MLATARKKMPENRPKSATNSGEEHFFKISKFGFSSPLKPFPQPLGTQLGLRDTNKNYHIHIFPFLGLFGPFLAIFGHFEVKIAEKDQKT